MAGLHGRAKVPHTAKRLGAYFGHHNGLRKEKELSTIGRAECGESVQGYCNMQLPHSRPHDFRPDGLGAIPPRNLCYLLNVSLSNASHAGMAELGKRVSARRQTALLMHLSVWPSQDLNFPAPRHLSSSQSGGLSLHSSYLSSVQTKNQFGPNRAVGRKERFATQRGMSAKPLLALG